MRRALELAPRGWGRVHPNPMVGAVLVRDGRVVGKGWHEEYGGPHAEVRAIEQAGSAARGATLYVTLEPCAHEGKTPPCTDAIQRAGIARVVFAAHDPDPHARGGGAVLAERGIAVQGGLLEDEARALDPAFFHARESSDCWVAIKLALSLDGRIAERPGAPTPITGEAARAEVHRLRAGFDAILVGSGTARADDPALTVRGRITPRSQPTRVVVDSNAALALDSRLARTAADVPVIVIAGDDAPAGRVRALEDAGVRVLRVPRVQDGVDPNAALAALRESGVHRVLCEGGGRMAASLLKAELVHRLYLFCAPRFIGPEGAPAFALDSALPRSWRFRDVRPIGEDVLFTLDPV